jgi:hypothetical protein
MENHMTELADLSDEALEAEVERRKRRKASAENDNVLREFVYNMCRDHTDGMHEAISTPVKASLGKSDYQLFLLEPHKFIFSLTGSYIGSR